MSIDTEYHIFDQRYSEELNLLLIFTERKTLAGIYHNSLSAFYYNIDYNLYNKSL